MKHWKNILGVLCMALLLCVGLALCTPAARADANLMENGSVQYTYIESEEALRHYIDNFGAYSVQEDIDGNTEYSNIYKITLDEPGQLIICPLARYRRSQTDNFKFFLYANYALTNELASIDTRTNDRQAMLHANVDAGTYYFRIKRKNSSYNAELTVFIGFVPASGEMKADTVTEEALQKSNITYDAVSVTETENASHFAHLIDSDLAFASYDQLSGNEQSKWYQFTVEKPGELLVSLLDFRKYSVIEVYSDATLSSKILYWEGEASTRNKFASVQLEPGTYYYRVYINNFNVSAYVYLGFIPQDGVIDPATFVESPPRVATPLRIESIEKASDISSLISASKATLATSVTKNSYTTVYSFTVEENGMLYIAGNTGSNGSVDLSLFSNRDCTSRLLNNVDIWSEIEYYPVFLEAGTYYISAYTDYNSYNLFLYMGFIPVSQIIAIDGMEADAEQCAVTFRVNEDYNPDLSRANIRVEPGYIHARSLADSDLWKESDRTNAIESHEFIATENGVYTARISGNGLDSYMFTFEVTAIGQEAAETEADQEPPVQEEAEPAQPSEPEPTPLPASEMRKYIRTLEDLAEENGLTLPDLAADMTQADYMAQLEALLHENGIYF